MADIRSGSPRHLIVTALFVLAFATLYSDVIAHRRHAEAVLSALESEGRSGEDWHEDLIDSSLRVVNPRIAALLREMMARSPTFDRQVREVASGDVPVLVGTYGDLDFELDAPFSGGVIYAAAPSLIRVEAILMGIRTDLHDEMYGGLDGRVIGVDPEVLRDGEIMGLLAHEFAHVYDVAVSGGNSLRICRDPWPWQADLDACVMIRENAIRSELGLPANPRYGMEWNGLRAAARYRAAGLGSGR